MSKSEIAAIDKAVPVLGFPSVLMRLAKELRDGKRFAGLWRVLTHV